MSTTNEECLSGLLNEFDQWVERIPKGLDLPTAQVLFSTVVVRLGLKFLNENVNAASGGQHGPGPRYVFAPAKDILEALLNTGNASTG